MRSPLLALAFDRPLAKTPSSLDHSAACGTIGQLVAQLKAPQPISVNATTALHCLQSVPVDTDANLQLIRHLNATIFQFESSTAYLKNPPPGYQQPAVDLQGGLQQIKQDTAAGTHYTNQYDFEFDLYSLVTSAHESHFAIAPGALSAFVFQGPFQLTSVSRDGQEMPELYAFTDLNSTIRGQASGWAASPLKTINGRDAATYVKQYASNFSLGALESHSDWNELMTNPAQLIQSYSGQFMGARIFSEAWFNVTFANGTERNQPSTAMVIPNKAWATITSGEDFYETFVRLPDSTEATDPAADVDSATKSSTSSLSQRAQALEAWPYPAYPSPFVIQRDFGKLKPQTAQGSSVSGYMLKDSSLGILSIPSFYMEGADAQSFATVVQQFLKEAKLAGLKRILIDVQGNGGGALFLGYELFKQFFPTLEPYTGSQLRMHETANLLGKTYSDFASDDKRMSDLRNKNDIIARGLVTWPWVAESDLNAKTRTNFRSWDELASGERYNGDQFSTTSLVDLKDTELTSVGVGATEIGGFAVYGYGNRTNVSAQPYEAKDIAILTNGLCGSTCSIFTELFTTVAGVKTVTAGGLPEAGQMQAVGETRGAQMYKTDVIIVQIKAGIELGLFNNETVDSLSDFFNTGVQLKTASFNLANQVRENSDLPLQFSYEPADCRIFYTHETFNNFTALWSYAAQAIFDKPSMCVKDSTGGKNNTKTSGTGVAASSSSSSASATASKSASVSTSDANIARRAGWLANVLSVVAMVLL